MTFDWTEYLALAQELGGRRPPVPAGPEARARSAISRAYYAAYVQARNYLRDKDHDPALPSSGQAHEYVRRQFWRSRDRRRRRVATLLHSLRVVRNQTDYEDSIPQL